MSPRPNRNERNCKRLGVCEPLESRRLLAASLVYNGAQTLTPGATINVSNNAGADHSEMSLVVNPTNPLNLVGFSHRLRPSPSPITVDVYSSSNGGATWTTNEIDNGDDSFGAAGDRFDPAIAFDANGICYIAYGHREAGSPNRTRLVGARSTDGGLTFGNFRTIDIQNDRDGGVGVDKWYLHSGLDPASGNQAVYVAYVHFALEGPMNNVNDDRILLAGTRDAGNTWTAPLLLNDPAATGAETGPTYACPVVGRNGEVAVTWHDRTDNTVMLDRDLDGLWGGPSTFGTDITVRTGVTVKRSTVIPPAQPQRGVNAAPMLEVWRNTNWLLETHVEQFGTGNDLDIWVGISQNFGETWSFQRVEGATSTDFNPWLQVDQRTGVFHVLYLSTDGDASGNDDIRPKIATSFDAGVNWQRGFLSAQTSNEAGGYGGDFLEYHGLAARDGTVHGLWPSRYAGGGTDLDAFTANAAYVSNISDNRLVIGETGAADDNYLVQLAPNNNAFLEVFVDGVREFTGLRQSINSIIFNPGGGTNSFSIGAVPGLSALTINGTNNADTIRIDALGANLPTLNMVLADDTDGDDFVTLGTGPSDFLTIQSPISISGQTGSDRLNIGSGFAQALAANVSFDGGPDGFDTIYYYDTQNTAQAVYDVSGGSVLYNGAIATNSVSYSNIDQIEFNAGSGGDLITVRSNVLVPIVRAFGNGGDDRFTVGDGAVPTGVRTFDGGAGTDDTASIDIRNDAVNRTYNITPTSVNPPGFTVNTPGVEKVTLLAGTGNDIINLTPGTYSQDLTVDAGGGSDVVNVVGARITALTVRGGTDSANDFLELFDASMPTNVVGGTVFADRIVRDTAVPLDVFYSGFSSVKWNQQNQQNVIVVRGISADINPSFQFSIIGNTVDDILEVHTQDTAGNPTILGNLSFNGGGGPDIIQVFAGPISENFRFYDPFGGGNTAYLASNGPRWVAIASDVETVQVYGGAQNDTFAVEKYSQGGSLSLFGGTGNDTCTIGNGDMSANLTSASFFGFDGQAGTADRFTIANGVANTLWTYTMNNGSLVAARPFTGYSWTSTLAGIESQYVFAGSSDDTFVVNGMAAGGVYTECHGAAGMDLMAVGSLANPLSNIVAPIVYNAGANGGSLSINDTADTTGDVVHVDANSVGAYAGDNLFGPGGSVTFTGLTTSTTFPFNGLALSLGSGADTVYAQPLPAAAVSISANNPTTTPGDVLNLATAGLTSPAIVGNAASGTLNSGNRQPLNWNNFEGSIAQDAVAPAVINADINVIGIPGIMEGGGNRQAVDVRFSENVSGLISPASLALTNLTTNQAIPTANIAVEYELATNTAHFTFPGYLNGILPDGDYSGRILAGLPDFFGNGLPADAPFSFFFLNGDANPDRRVNLDDFNILATNFGQSGRTWAQGNFNYDPAGFVNLDDFNILAAQFGHALGPEGAIARRTEFGQFPIRPSGKLRDNDLAALLAEVV